MPHSLSLRLISGRYPCEVKAHETTRTASMKSMFLCASLAALAATPASADDSTPVILPLLVPGADQTNDPWLPAASGFGLNGIVPNGASGLAGVPCNFGSELLLASTVDSCENAGGAVAPSPRTYSVRCEITGETVMSGSTASCVRLNGKVAAK